MIKLTNLNVVPPFFWINQYGRILHWRCCGAKFDVVTIRFTRDRHGGWNFTAIIVVLGLGFCWSWYDRNDRARFLAGMDQIEETAKDFLREVIGEEDDDE